MDVPGKLWSHMLVLTAALLLTAAPLGAESPAETHLVLFTRQGPNWAQGPQVPEGAAHHRDLYQRLVDEGVILGAGPLEGQPMMGIAIFRQGVDEAAVRQRLGEDILVQRGVITLDYRRWTVRGGSLAAAERPSKP